MEIKLTIEEYKNLLGMAYFCKYNIDDISVPIEGNKERLQVLVDEFTQLEKDNNAKMLNQ